MLKTSLGYLIFIVVFLLSSSCVPPLPGSKPYQPVDWEKELIIKSNKLVMPSDLLQDSGTYKDSLIHWVGIVDTFFVETRDSLTVSRILFEQKYYDYIEDYSIQQEIFFVSPHGEGTFIMEKAYGDVPKDSVIKDLKKNVKPSNLGFCYGVFRNIQDGKPVLEAVGLRIIDSRFYSTNIMSYQIVRDSLGNVVAGPDGYPSLTDFKILNIPGAGKN